MVGSTSDWPDEEAVTGGLLTTLETAVNLTQVATPSRLDLQATYTKRHNEAEHGVDALIRFRCSSRDWNLETAVLLQAKRQEPGAPFDKKAHDRLNRQLGSMLIYTPESFVLVYSQLHGVCLFPAVAARALPSRHLFDIAFITWEDYLSGVFRGRFGDVSGRRLPPEAGGWMPMFELEIRAYADEAPEEAPLRMSF